MIQYRNTKEDFWNTLDQQHGSIICPCCGREMSLQYSTSYRLKFTPNTCSIMNHQLELYRQTIFMIENSLRRHNSREINYYSKDTCYSVDQENMQSDGSINSPIAEKVSKFIGELNMEKIDDVVRDVPRLSAFEERKYTGEKFLRIFEPPHLNGGLIDLTFEQPKIDRLLTIEVPAIYIINKLNDTDCEENHRGNIILEQLRRRLPSIMEYCQKIALYDKEKNATESLSKLIAILEVYFGDTEGAVYDLVIEKFSFGNYSIFRDWKTLALLLKSSYFISKLKNQFQSYCDFVEQNTEEAQKNIDELADTLCLGSNTNKAKLDNLLQHVDGLKDVILYMTDFVCAGAPATIPSGAAYTRRFHNQKKISLIKDEVEVEAEICGWLPKEEPTESLLLVGGTASSKTTLLQATIVQVKRAAAKLKMIFEPCSPLSKMLLDYYEQHYDDGKWSGATETGSRTSLQLKLFQAAEPSKVSYLVINDIAGEKFEEMLQKETNFEEIESPLANANNIIFLFDLVAWRHLMTLTNESSTDEWKKIKEQKDNHAESGRGCMDSHALLIDFISKLKQMHGNKEELIDRTFMLVIPKADLYIGEGMFLRQWIDKLVKNKFLEQVGTDGAGKYMTTWEFPNEKGDNKFAVALNAIKNMSQLAEEAIKEVAKGQEEESEAAISEKRIAQQVEATLLYLQKTFKDVKVVPVSALGQDPEIKTATSEEFECKATPLFCEALLLLPIIKNYSDDSKLSN